MLFAKFGVPVAGSIVAYRDACGILEKMAKTESPYQQACELLEKVQKGALLKADFDESEHPRDDSGQFASDGGAAEPKKKPTSAEPPPIKCDRCHGTGNVSSSIQRGNRESVCYRCGGQGWLKGKKEPGENGESVGGCAQGQERCRARGEIGDEGLGAQVPHGSVCSR